jgi:hypothetical protein
MSFVMKNTHRKEQMYVIAPAFGPDVYNHILSTVSRMLYVRYSWFFSREAMREVNSGLIGRIASV